MAQIVTGAMYGGQILPKEEFISKVSEMLILNKELMVKELLAIETKIKISPQAAYIAWESFSSRIMGNPKTQLLSILNFYNQNESQTWSLTNEEYAIEPSGLINVQRVGQEIRKDYNSQILTRHLGQMFQTVTNTKISSKTLSYLVKTYNFTPKYKKGQAKTYANVFWSKQEQGFKMRGQVAEAFLMHLAKMHLSLLDSKEQLEMDFSNQSILDKEGEKGFVELLYASKNRDAWFTGGDLIITNRQGQVIANIQLKTSMKEGAAIGTIKTSGLKKQIDLLLQKINHPQEMAERFYNMLATSSVMSEIDAKIDSTGYNFVEQMFSQFANS